MKKLFEIAECYVARSDWSDFALVKLCLFALGIIAGLFIPQEARNIALYVAIALFAITYVLLMRRFFAAVKVFKAKK